MTYGEYKQYNYKQMVMLPKLSEWQKARAKGAKGLQRRLSVQCMYCRGEVLQGCTLKLKCLIGRGGRRKCLWDPIAAQLNNLPRRMAGKIDTETGRKNYPRRIAIAEPVSANIRTHKWLGRFTLRGKIKVSIQWQLSCMVHNTGNIANYGFS